MLRLGVIFKNATHFLWDKEGLSLAWRSPVRLTESASPQGSPVLTSPSNSGPQACEAHSLLNWALSPAPENLFTDYLVCWKKLLIEYPNCTMKDFETLFCTFPCSMISVLNWLIEIWEVSFVRSKRVKVAEIPLGISNRLCLPSLELQWTGWCRPSPAGSACTQQPS